MLLNGMFKNVAKISKLRQQIFRKNTDIFYAYFQFVSTSESLVTIKPLTKESLKMLIESFSDDLRLRPAFLLAMREERDEQVFCLGFVDGVY